jgi:hypothetical protein
MTSLLRASEESETRILSRIGAVVVLGIVVVIAVGFAVNPFGGTPKNVISVAIETPYVGQGVVSGTPLIMHGVKVGEVTAVSSLPSGLVRLNTDVQSGLTGGLTDAVGIDFRPSNYFGVTGVNLIPGQGGQPLRNGAQISVTPRGNFALQALLYRLGEISNQVVTPRLIGVFDRATRYTDGLNPLLETMIIVSTSVANVQTVSTAQLLRNATGINVGLPGFLDALVDTGDKYLHSLMGLGYKKDADDRNNPYLSTYDDLQLKSYNAAGHLMEANPDEFVFGRFQEWLRGAETDLFSKVGHLLSTHMYELFPVVEEIRAITDIVPKLVPAGDISDTLRELRTRLEHMYAGSGDQAAPLNLVLGAGG